MNSMTNEEDSYYCYSCKQKYSKRFEGDVTNIEIKYNSNEKTVEYGIYNLCPDCLKRFRDAITYVVWKEKFDE